MLNTSIAINSVIFKLFSTRDDKHKIKPFVFICQEL